MKPPLLARALLMAVAGPGEAEYAAGDLEEEFATVRESRGPAAAQRWYAWQVIRSVASLLQLRVRSGELTQAALIASFGIAAPLLLLDKLWQFVYSQIPLKDGLQRAPEFLVFNLLCVCACAALVGGWVGLKRPASRSRALAVAAASAIAVSVALLSDAASAPADYVVTLTLAVPASVLLTFEWRKSR